MCIWGPGRNICMQMTESGSNRGSTGPHPTVSGASRLIQSDLSRYNVQITQIMWNQKCCEDFLESPGLLLLGVDIPIPQSIKPKLSACFHIKRSKSETYIDLFLQSFISQFENPKKLERCSCWWWLYAWWVTAANTSLSHKNCIRLPTMRPFGSLTLKSSLCISPLRFSKRAFVRGNTCTEL